MFSKKSQSKSTRRTLPKSSRQMRLITSIGLTAQYGNKEHTPHEHDREHATALALAIYTPATAANIVPATPETSCKDINAKVYAQPQIAAEAEAINDATTKAMLALEAERTAAGLPSLSPNIRQ